MKRMKPITEEQAGRAVAHWRRALTQKEANAAAAAVKKAFEDAGIEADVSGPVLLAKGETSLFGRTYRYSAGKCPLWGCLRGPGSLGWASPCVVARLKEPVKEVRCPALGNSTVRDLTEIRVEVELCAGVLPGGGPGPYPHDLHWDVKGARARAEAIDADPGWGCEVWNADVYADGLERGYRGRHWCRYQPRSPFVYSATQEGLHAKIAATVDSIAGDLGIGKYAKARRGPRVSGRYDLSK